MVNDSVPLSYASSDPAALQPGETLLWEGGSIRPRRWWHGRPVQPTFRITDRRAFYALGPPRADLHRAAVSLPVPGTIIVREPHRGPATLDLGPLLWVTGLDDWRAPARLVSAVPRRRPPHRRRRQPPRPETRMIEPGHVDVDPRELALLADERVLWSGRPSPRSPSVGQPSARNSPRSHGRACRPPCWRGSSCWAGHQPAVIIFGVLATLWIVASAYSITIAPARRRWRLARSSYVLTTRRAVAIAPFRGGRQVTFVFLDSLSATFSRRQWPDGFGDVDVSPVVMFERVADPVAVHARLVEAVLAARRDLPDLGWSTADLARPAD